MKTLIVRRVIGASMSPTLKQGKIIIASKIKRIKLGRIVIARVEGREVIKRVDKIKGKKIWLISDNQLSGRDSRHYGPIDINNVIATKFI